ncbi:MAG: hypothetical protein IJ656_01245 [Bacilli bacterium]|nr:hypothetical protein [Bacilli bacterium]
MEEIQGITILISKYKEKDAILNVLTRNGFYEILGRSIFDFKSKNFIFSKKFINCKYEIYKGGVGGYKLKDGTFLKEYVNSNNYNSLIALDYIEEIINKTRDGIDSYSELYDLLENTLIDLNDKNIFEVLCYFTKKLTKLLGINLLVKETDSNKFYINIKEGVISKFKSDDSLEISERELNFFLNDEYITDFDAQKVLYYESMLIMDKFNIKLNSLQLLFYY